MKIELFKPFLDKIRNILSTKIDVSPVGVPVEDLLKSIEEDEQVIKAALDNEIIDLEEFVEKMDELKKKKEDLKVKKQDYADAIITNEKGEILFLLRTLTDTFCPGCWSLPGGKIDKGETPEQAVIREVKEETNLTIINPVLILTKEIDNGNIYYFTCQVENKLIEPSIILVNDEHQGYSFMNKEKWSEVPLLLDLDDTIDSIIGDITEMTFDLFPTFGNDHSKYSNIEEAIANTHNFPKDNFMLNLFAKGEIEDDDYVDYIEKAYSDPSHGGKLTQLKAQDKNGKLVRKWVSKGELKKLANHAKHTPKSNLEKVVKEHPNPNIREVANSELSRREKDEKEPEEKENYETHPYHGKEIKFNPDDGSAQDEEGNSIDIKKLHEYYDMKNNSIVEKMQTMTDELTKSIKKHKRVKNKLLKEFYNKITKTHFSVSKDVPSAYKSSIMIIEKMGLKEEDVDKDKLTKILIKKFGG